ncbi:tetratricopeptide repeat protein [Aliifodinibius sp. S!AR15-10]|uniref:tetratricopeptide repeat protein n=1 Tax=Aliifodinibius sp. S!AR15-10 TaxID=2950437 RepID=UPI0028612C0D|nr:tetratricopeptide repeat protein [Aliifodinibius sp. S!AR15-10]MDR8391095.1 tetratricopeptide repeat protein [Aliifodinibius sp. S!AR15-10]
MKINVEQLTKIYGNSHPYIARTKLNQGKLYFKTKEFKKAKKLLSRVNREYQQIFPPDHPRTSDPHLQLGLLYLETDEREKADQHLKKTYIIRTQGYPADSWRVAQTMNVYSTYLSEQQQFSEADSLLVQGYENLRKNPGCIRPVHSRGGKSNYLTL